jgi:hypothetical protein
MTNFNESEKKSLNREEILVMLEQTSEVGIGLSQEKIS